MAANINVVPAGDGWAVEAASGGRRTLYSTQEEAILAGTERAQRDKVELLIYGRNGQLRDRSSYSNDLRNVPG